MPMQGAQGEWADKKSLTKRQEADLMEIPDQCSRTTQSGSKPMS